jgi:thiamine kinase-like enzyme
MQWLEGSRPLRVEEMGDPVFSPAIAAAMAKLHRFPVPPELKEHYAKPGMWDQLWLWYEQAAAEETGAKIKARSEADAAQLAEIDLVRVRAMLQQTHLHWRECNDPILLFCRIRAQLQAKEELDKLQASIPEDVPVAFCHNDLLAANIMVNDATREVTLIDFEYGGTVRLAQRAPPLACLRSLPFSAVGPTARRNCLLCARPELSRL